MIFENYTLKQVHDICKKNWPDCKMCPFSEYNWFNQQYACQFSFTPNCWKIKEETKNEDEVL